MAKRQPLQPPDWPGSLPNCPCCGYDLRGLALPGSCSECGYGVDEGVMVLSGVLRGNIATSPIRRACWGLLICFAVFIAYTWNFLVFMIPNGPYLFLGAVLGVIVMTTLLLRTSKSDGAGRHKIVFGPSGFSATAELDAENPTGTVVGWEHVAGFKVKPVSSVWHNLVIESRTAGKLLKAGILCNAEDAHRIRETLAGYLGSMGYAQAEPPSTA